MFGYGDDAPVPDLGLPRNGRLSLMEEVDDLIGSTARLTQSPAGHLSPSAKRSGCTRRSPFALVLLR